MPSDAFSNTLLPPRPGDKCYEYMLRVAAETVEQDGIWERITEVDPPPNGTGMTVSPRRVPVAA